MNVTHEHIDRFVEILSKHGDVILLESQKYDHPASTRSYLAAISERSIFGLDDKVVQTIEGNETEFSANSWDCIKNFRDETQDWMFGYFGYDLKNEIEALTSKNRALNNFPIFYFG